MKKELMSTQKSKGLTLLKQGRKGLAHVLFSRTGLVSILLLLQFGLLFVLFWRFSQFLPHFFGGTAIFTVVMVLSLINGRHDPSAKITWLLIIMLVPVFGSLLYLYTQSDA